MNTIGISLLFWNQRCEEFHDLFLLQEMTTDELSERYALVKKLKSELKNEEMALVLLKKLKQSQTQQREGTTVGGGATLTPATKSGAKDKTSFSSKNSDLAMAKELVSIAIYTKRVPFLITQ